MRTPFSDRRQLSEAGQTNLLVIRGVIVFGITAILSAVVLVAFASKVEPQVVILLVSGAMNLGSGLVGYLAREPKNIPGGPSVPTTTTSTQTPEGGSVVEITTGGEVDAPVPPMAPVPPNAPVVTDKDESP